MYGWAPEQMVGRPVRDFLHPDDHERHAQVRASLHDGTYEQGAEFRVPCADGRWLWVEMHFSVLRNRDGSLREVQAAARDISDRKVAEAARRVADEQFRTAFDDAPIGMALVAPDGEWLRVNPALCDIVGYSREELLGKTFQDITHPDDLDADVGLLRQVLAGERSGYQLEKRYLRSTGDVVWALLSVSLVRDASGQPLHFISQVQDVSERKALEAQLRRLATRDDLTGLSNRRMFQRALSQQIPRIGRYGEEASVLVARPRRLQGRQRHPRPPRRRRAAAPRRRGAGARACARATSSRGSAATSSRSSCPAPTAPPRLRSRRRWSTTSRRTRSCSTVWRSTRGSASASRSSMPRDGRTTRCARPTGRCTGSSRSGARRRQDSLRDAQLLSDEDLVGIVEDGAVRLEDRGVPGRIAVELLGDRRQRVA